jgi:hypothetical protein
MPSYCPASVRDDRCFLTGAYDEELGVKDVTWLTPVAQEMTPENWNDPHARSLGVLLDGRGDWHSPHRIRLDVAHSR